MAQHSSQPEGVVRGPRVTVVVMTRDRCANVLTTLRHLTALPERPPIVLVDNGSSDGTVEAVRRAFAGVDVVALGANAGAPARTAGVARSRTPYVAFADDDSWWEPGALDRAADVLDDHPRFGLVAARILVGPERRTDPVCALMADSPLPRAAGAPGPRILGFVACGAVVRRAAYLEVGGFSDLLFFYGEEALLAQDLLAAGWDLAYVDEVVALHHPGTSGRDDRDRLAVRNGLLTAWMRRPAGVALRRSLALVLARRDRVALGGLWDALRDGRRALAARAVLPPGVERQVALLDRSGRCAPLASGSPRRVPSAP